MDRCRNVNLQRSARASQRESRDCCTFSEFMQMSLYRVTRLGEVDRRSLSVATSKKDLRPYQTAPYVAGLQMARFARSAVRK